MARPLRIELPGGIYHVTTRGNRLKPIFCDDDDRARLLSTLSQGTSRFDAVIMAYCLMGNHYHVVVHTRQPNLSRLMRHVNGLYAQSFNRRHDVSGHLFQGRFHAIHVDRDGYLAALCRYVELNPVRAGLVEAAAAWPWSSYRAHTGLASCPDWLDSKDLHGLLSGTDVHDAADLQLAQERYAALVASDARSPDRLPTPRQDIYLGSREFVAQVQARMSEAEASCLEIPRAQRRPPASLADWLASGTSRHESLRRAYAEGGMTMAEIATELGVSVSWVSRLISRAESGLPGPSHTRRRARRVARQ